tara:strand:+ start:943 stop:1125 length:183 start_codon:yes stop_codon:yes gene_type:complete
MTKSEIEKILQGWFQEAIYEGLERGLDEKMAFEIARMAVDIKQQTHDWSSSELNWTPLSK